jgi:hypothetical protein
MPENAYIEQKYGLILPVYVESTESKHNSADVWQKEIHGWIEKERSTEGRAVNMSKEPVSL